MSLIDNERNIEISGYKGTKYHRGFLTEHVKQSMEKIRSLFHDFEDEMTDGLGFSDNSFIKDMNEELGEELSK